jgi:integrase
MKILAALPREGNFVFIGTRGGRPLNRHAMHELMGLMGLPFTVHGFRSSFRDWAAECTGYEAALAHAIPGAVERAYRRGDLLAKRQRLMADWAAFCSGVASPTAMSSRSVAAVMVKRNLTKFRNQF